MSMATPTNRGAMKGSPLTMLTTGTTTTGTEDESEGGTTTDESVLEWRCALNDKTRDRVKKRKQLKPRARGEKVRLGMCDEY